MRAKRPLGDDRPGHTPRTRLHPGTGHLEPSPQRRSAPATHPDRGQGDEGGGRSPGSRVVAPRPCLPGFPVADAGRGSAPTVAGAATDWARRPHRVPSFLPYRGTVAGTEAAAGPGPASSVRDADRRAMLARALRSCSSGALLLRRHGPALAFDRAADLGARGAHVRSALDGYALRHRLLQPPAGCAARGLARWLLVRPYPFPTFRSG